MAGKNLDATPKPTVTPVKSGSGVPSVNAEAVKAGDFAYGDLGNGTAGGLGNAALINTQTILPNTRRTTISKKQLEEADHNYTTTMNQLSTFWSAGDTSSPGYEQAKQNAMQAQYKWELARNNLEEVAIQEKSIAREPILNVNDIGPALTTPVDLSGLSQELVPSTGEEVNTDAEPEDIVVTARKKADERLKIRAKGIDAEWLYQGIMLPLSETNGVVFPYTPVITHQHRAEYSKMSPTHANTDYYTYTNSPAVQIQVQAQFSAQNQDEAAYLLAAIHFFRTVTKMHFGSLDTNAGLPPPVLVFDGYGVMFNKLNVIVTDFSMEMPNNVDYLEVRSDGNSAWVPALTTFNITCVVQQTPAMQRDEFNINDFATGTLLRKGGWI